MNHILVTGANGFVGTHLCRHLLEKGFRVRGTFFGPCPEDPMLQQVEWVDIGDIGPETDWSQALEGVTQIIHLAAMAHRIGEGSDGLAAAFYRINTEGTRSLAQAATQSATMKRLIFISSIGTMGSFSKAPLRLDSPGEPDSDYGRSKLKAEEALREVLGGTTIEWCILRPCLIYGPGNPGNMARLMRLLELGLPLPVASIRNRRTFLYIGNLLSAMERCLEHPAAARATFLLCDREITSTAELMRKLAQYSRKPARLFSFPSLSLRLLGRLGDLVHVLTRRSIGIDTYSVDRLLGSLEVDPTPTFESLDWTPPYTLDEGLRLTMSRPNQVPFNFRWVSRS